FFSSRRRHTRFSRDWSSDVCSSDLANVFWGLQGAAIPAVIQHHAARDAVGSAYGIINGIGNICAAFIPLLMGMVMRSVGSVSSGFSVLVVSQVVTLLAGGMLLLRMRRAAAISA